MRKRIFVLASVALCGASPALCQSVPAGDSASIETVKRMLVVTKAEEYHAQLMREFSARWAETPGLSSDAVEKARAFFQKHLGFAAIEGDVIALHRQYYSESDLREIIRFYESPVGQRAVVVIPLLSSRLNQIAVARVTALMPELMREVGLGKSPPDH